LVVVGDASPLIILSKLGRLSLLIDLYELILIPQAVYEEAVVAGLREGHVDAIAIDHLVRLGHISVQSVRLSGQEKEWMHTIDSGEAEVIALARKNDANLALIDNAHARRAARALGVPVRGTVGILLEAVAKRQLTLPEFRLLIQEIKNRPEFWIGDRLCDAALDKVRDLT
jgi:predicted nucleic acid-binding protein